jgi:hypothetical protein
MPLWGTTATAATNKPKHLTNDVNSPYDITTVYADNSGWVQRPGAGSGNNNKDAQPEILVAIGGLAGITTSTGLKHPTITRIRWGEAAYVAATAITVLVTWDEQVMYTAGSAATLVVVSTGTNITVTATHFDGVGISNGIKGNTITFTGTTVDEAATLSISDDTAIGDPDLYDALGAQDALSGADSTTITAAVKTASGYSTRAVTT